MEKGKQKVRNEDLGGVEEEDLGVKIPINLKAEFQSDVAKIRPKTSMKKVVAEMIKKYLKRRSLE